MKEWRVAELRHAPAGDSSRAGSEVGRGEGTAEESPPAGGVMDDTDCSRQPTMQNQHNGKAKYIVNEANRRASVRSPCISVCAAVDQVL